MKRNRYVARAYPAPVVRGVNRYRWWKRLLRRWGLA